MQELKPGTLLRLKTPWINPHHGMQLKPGDVILLVKHRKVDGFLAPETSFNFEAITPDGFVKPFAWQGNLDVYFEVVETKKQNAV